jgi:outer membrane protein OmpA-like peptidoglycan-associated protein
MKKHTIIENQQGQGDTSENGYRYLYYLTAAVVFAAALIFIAKSYTNPAEINSYFDSLNTSKAVYFDFGSAVLEESSYPELDKIATMLQSNGNAQLVITGHTDNIGSEEFNIELSEKRAEVVKEYLISKGIDGSRMMVKAKGFSEPADNNNNATSRAMNRRVEFTLTENNRKPAPEEKTETFMNASITKNTGDSLDLNVSLRDTAGEPITTVTEEDISATLKWQSETKVDSITGVPRLIPIDEQKRIAFTFTMDYSPSMYNGSFDKFAPKTEQILRMEKAVTYFIENMDNKFLAKFIKFGKVVNVVQGFTMDRQLMINAIKNGSFPRSGTAVYRSIYDALRDQAYENNPSIIKTVIAFTDGEENSSGLITKDSIYRLSEEKGVKVYTVGLIIPGFHSEPLGLNSKAESDLLEIAQRTGGFYYWASDANILESIYKRIYEQIMKSYQLSIIWDKTGLPPKGTNVTAVLRININGRVRTIHKSYIMQ